jgi:DNA-binding response OmpR family regulator
MYINDKPIQVVLTDDDEDDRELFGEALSQLNFKVKLKTYQDCNSMVNAVLKIKKADLPNVIFLDINMPGKTGLDCLKELKADAHCKEVPVVMFTTSSSLSDVQESRKLGADLFLNKPQDFKELVSILNKLITPTGFQMANSADLRPSAGL